MLKLKPAVAAIAAILMMVIGAGAVGPGVSANSILAQVVPGTPPPNDLPRKREEYFRQQRSAPFADLPASALLQARTEADDRVRSGAIPLARAGRSAAAITEGAWTAVGPAPIADGFQKYGAGTQPTSGRVPAIAVVDANTVYIGSANGGVWKTTNGGTTWAALTDREPYLAIGALALDPNVANGQTLYAGLGEQNNTGSSFNGNGFLKTIDGGQTWTRFLPSFLDKQRIGRMAVDPNNSNRVYAATSNGLAISSNAGVTWTQSSDTLLGDGAFISDVVIDSSTNPSTVYAARGDTSGSLDNGIFKGTTAADTWVKLNGTGIFPSVAATGRIRLALVRASTPTRLYALVHTVVGSNNQILGVWSMATNALTWTATTNPEVSAGILTANICTQCDYDLNIAVYSGNTGTAATDSVFVMGTEILGSTNGGTTWTNVSQGYIMPYKMHVDQHALEFVPGSPTSFYIGNDGGVYKTTDGGSTLTGVNSGGLSITQFYRGSADPSNVASALGGSQDNGTLFYTGQASWYASVGGDGGYAAIDYLTPTNVYASTQELGFNRSTSGASDGSTFQPATNGIPGKSTEPRQFIAPVVMDPTNPQVLYAGTTRLYRTTDGAQNWAAISNSLASANSSFSAISAIAPARSAPNTIYVGTGSSQGATSKLWVTTDLGTTWNDRTGTLPNRTITAIAVHPTDANTAYVAVSGFGTGHVWKTIDAGVTWTDSSGTLPNAPANSIVVHPTDAGTVYVATDVGVYKSANAGAAWTDLTTNTVMPNVVVNDLVINRAATRLFAFTHGRGLYVATIADAVVTATSIPTLTSTPSPTFTPTMTSTPLPTCTSAATCTPTPIPTVTLTSTITSTPTISPTSTITSTPTVSPTSMITSTPTVSPTSMITSTPTISPTSMITSTPTVSPTSISRSSKIFIPVGPSRQGL